MGWRKLTVRDGGLARCCAAQRPIICGANLRFVLMRQHYPWQSDSGQQPCADWTDSVPGCRPGPRM